MMQEILMMVMTGCPHCQRAFEMMEALREQYPEFQSIPVKVVNETLEPDFAATLDYYYVPTFFVAGVKLHEGKPTKDAVEAVFRYALTQK